MPLRSVEAATRDDAIAAAREQFGPHARVVGVRRVRSGGVLGFFATERYVAEVADQFARPGAPTPSTGPSPAASVSSFESPLAAAAPARARTTAPARNGAAAWAAEAARPVESARGPLTGSRPAAAPAPAADDQDRLDELAGLLGGLPAAAPRASSPAGGALATSSAALSAEASRAAFPRTSTSRAPRPAPAQVSTPAPSSPFSGSASGGSAFGGSTSVGSASVGSASVGSASGGSASDGSSFVGASSTATPSPFGASPFAAAAEPGDAPSPFTAALARMVSGDREVQQAVAHALEEPAGPKAFEPERLAPEPASRQREKHGAAAPDTRTPRPSLAAAIRSADTSTRSRAVAQEETTVEEQVVTAPSTSTSSTVPAWAAAEETPAPPVSTRQEEIAEVLRSALAQGQSDEALAGILRKMLAGDSPQEALAEPVEQAAAPAPVEAAAVEAAPVVAPAAPIEAVTPAVVATGTEPAPVEVELSAAAPTDLTPEAPSSDEPAPQEPAPTELPSSNWNLTANYSLFGIPLPTSGSTGLGWDAPAPAPGYTPLWGEPVIEESAPVSSTDAPIWAEVLRQESGSGTEQPAEAPASPDEVTAEAADPAADVWAETTTVGNTAAEITAAEVTAAEVTAAEPIEAQPVESPSAEAAADLEVADAGEDEARLEVEVEIEDEAGSVEAAAVEAAAVEEAQDQVSAGSEAAGDLAPLLARTASDPAPMTMSMDATTVMPRVSLLPPLPGSRTRGGLPPVPPSASRPAVPPARPRPEKPLAAETETEAVPPSRDEAGRAPARTLATVTRLPVAPLMAGPDLPEMPELDDTDEDVPAAGRGAEVAARLRTLGLPADLLGAGFAEQVLSHGTYAALTRALAGSLPAIPQLPSGAGDVLFVVGPGVETLRAAQSLAATLRLDPDRVQWATRGDLAGLAPSASRVSTIDTAIERRQETAASGTLTIVAVDAPLRGDAYWMEQMLAVWSPAAVWALVEATRKPEDVELWLAGLTRVDALAVQDTDLSADPAAVLRHLDTPVALLDGVRATPHRWASLLCERLENPQA
ncbi:hypothetical protein DQ237_15820 [Blastococcus sp. TF02-8]|uniref:hypothetical protein n=1 Tax=Blastococcus sp. TF02-8 TaxID=2250574 RepID=UPI000DE88520|nr:hypothetical protein [Blastococcus sp. TF02-8]RBY95155.1 hypothetical protein DQ237_15820 [Blastococcus sp. TF02-8]